MEYYPAYYSLIPRFPWNMNMWGEPGQLQCLRSGVGETGNEASVCTLLEYVLCRYWHTSIVYSPDFILCVYMTVDSGHVEVLLSQYWWFSQVSFPDPHYSTHSEDLTEGLGTRPCLAFLLYSLGLNGPIMTPHAAMLSVLLCSVLCQHDPPMHTLVMVQPPRGSDIMSPTFLKSWCFLVERVRNKKNPWSSWDLIVRRSYH